ncbi:hypothetical protein FRC11_011734 [Ceratobasidium sp. 423]|nr:hypothetical protein FRC11_011734 [Ceratobasidium sp. 423]
MGWRGGVTGNVGQINVEFTGFSVTNQTFIIESKSTAGILGLGFDTFSKINGFVRKTFSGATWGHSLLSNISPSDLSAPDHIAFSLNRLYDGDDTDTGSFDIGTFVYNTYTVYNFGDFVNGTPGDRRQDLYVKLLPLTDAGAASTEFQSARKMYLNTLPPEFSVSAVKLRMSTSITYLAAIVVGAMSWPQTEYSINY